MGTGMAVWSLTRTSKTQDAAGAIQDDMLKHKNRSFTCQSHNVPSCRRHHRHDTWLLLRGFQVVVLRPKLRSLISSHTHPPKTARQSGNYISPTHPTQLFIEADVGPLAVTNGLNRVSAPACPSRPFSRTNLV